MMTAAIIGICFLFAALALIAPAISSEHARNRVRMKKRSSTPPKAAQRIGSRGGERAAVPSHLPAPPLPPDQV